MTRKSRRRTPAPERFWPKVSLGENGCWVWVGAVTPHGYGAFWVGGQMRPAHRFSYEQMVAEIPEGLHLDHLCRNRACVNPWHLDPVTCQVNVSRGDSAHGGVWVQRQKAQTHCPQGHPLKADNLYVTPKGGRVCITCNRASTRRSRQRRKDAPEIRLVPGSVAHFVVKIEDLGEVTV